MQINTNSILAKDFSSKAEITKAIKRFSDRLSELESLVSGTRSKLTNFIAKVFEVNVKKPTPDPDYPISPRVSHINPSPLITDYKQLTDSYGVISEISSIRSGLQALLSRVSIGYEGDQKEDVVGTVKRLISKADSVFHSALNLISSLSSKHRPEKLDKLSRAFRRSLELTVDYHSCFAETYLWVDDGDLVLSDYVVLKNVMDERGRSVPALYLILSVKLSGNNTSFYAGVSYSHVLPAKDILTKKVGTLKTLLSAFDSLLSGDNVTTRIADAPVKFLLEDSLPSETIYKDILRTIYAEKCIVKVRADYGQINFDLAPRITEQDKVNDMLAAVYYWFKPFLDSRDDMRITMRLNRSPSNYVLTYGFISRSSEPLSFSPDDLMFLTTKLGISEANRKKLLESIYSTSN